MKKTAVEWLMQELIRHGSGAVKTFPELFEKAKEMEKQQIMNAWDDVGFSWAEDSEQYYNETFKSE